MKIRVENLHKSFRGKPVLRGVNLEVDSGELCVIVGGSGTGKSVLLKHLVGLIKPDEGHIYLDDEDIVGLSERQLLPYRKRIGMIFQSAGLLQSLPVGQNVGLVLDELNHKRPEEIREIVAEKLKQLGLEGREDQMPSTLSGGEKKRAAIARAMTTEVDCLLYDEPTTGLDPPMSDNIDELIQEVNRDTGATSVVVTHDLVTVLGIADQVHMLHEGKIIASGTPAEFQKMDDERVVEFLARSKEGPKPQSR